MLSRYAFEFDTYDNAFWDYISQNPSKTGIDGHLPPLYYVSNGIVHVPNSLLDNIGKYGYIDSSTKDGGKRVYFSIAFKKVTAGVDVDDYFGVSLRS